MDFSLVDAQRDIKQLAHHLPVKMLVPFAYLNKTIANVCVHRKFKELRLDYEDGIVELREDEDQEEALLSYHPKSIFHDGPVECGTLVVIGNCQVPPEAVKCQKLFVNVRRVTIPLLTRNINSLMIYPRELKQRAPRFTLRELLQRMGPNLAELQLPIADFTDGARFVNRITEFRANCPGSKLKVLSVIHKTLQGAIRCIQQNLDFIRHNDFLDMMIVSLLPFQPLSQKSLNRVKTLLSKYFIYVETYAPTDRKVLFYYDSMTWMKFIMPPKVDTGSDDKGTSVDIDEEVVEEEQAREEVPVIPSPDIIEEQLSINGHFIVEIPGECSDKTDSAYVASLIPQMVLRSWNACCVFVFNLSFFVSLFGFIRNLIR